MDTFVLCQSRLLSSDQILVATPGEARCAAHVVASSLVGFEVCAETMLMHDRECYGLGISKTPTVDLETLMMCEANAPQTTQLRVRYGIIGPAQCGHSG